jgi:hypothetical protein
VPAAPSKENMNLKAFLLSEFNSSITKYREFYNLQSLVFVLQLNGSHEKMR